MSIQDNYQKVLEEIARRRTSARAEADARDLEVRALSPELAEIDVELAGTGIKIFGAACHGADLSALRERNAALMQRRREIIKFLGYPEDYTDVHYTCTKCSDSGYTADGRLCTCFKEALAIENIKSSGLGRLFEKQSFETFDLERFSYDPYIYEMMKRNYNMAKRYARDFGKQQQNLVMMGYTGTGKTHLCTAIAREVISRGYTVIYETAQNIISDFEADRFRSGYGPYEPKAQKYHECDLLIIDDLGTEFVNQFSVSCIHNLMNTRYNRDLCTVISTNLSIDQMRDKYDDRVVSRIINSSAQILMFEGNDLRLL